MDTDNDMDVEPKLAKKPIRPRPVAKTKVPNVADQRDLATDKGSSAQNRIRKFLFVFFAVVVHELASFRSQH
jgi:hypothetical protein